MAMHPHARVSAHGQPHAGKSDARQETSLPDQTGWDDAAHSRGADWTADAEPPPRGWDPVAVYVTAGVVLVLMTMVLLAIVLPNPRHNGGFPTNETATVQNLKALATAQAQYIKKTDAYAASGHELNETGTLIAADLKNAFENWQNNGDQATPRPKAGYIYRMLQGDDLANLNSYLKDADDPSAGMNTWAATARASEPGISGENQYYITEAGTVYKFPESKPGQAFYKLFRLSCAPPQSQTTWVTAK